MRKTEDKLAALKSVRNLSGEIADAALQKGLQDRSNLVVAESAKLIAELRRTALIPELLKTFNRLFDDPVKSDSRCWGKLAIIKALTLLNHEHSVPFLRASKHVQMEPVYGGLEDSANHLRANAVLALVQCTDLTRQEVLRHVVTALVDRSDTVRVEAVRTLEQLDGDESILLLRLKAHVGDERSAVAGQVFDSILVLERENGVPFVAQFLSSSNDETRDEAALALGASRLPAAVSELSETWKKVSKDREFSSVLLRALSSSRDEKALTFLLELLERGLSRDADLALEALALHTGSAEIEERIMHAKARRDQSPNR